MAIHWQLINPAAKPYQAKGIKYGNSLDKIIPVTNPYRLKDKGTNMDIIQEIVSPIFKPCNEVQAPVQDHTNQTSSIKSTVICMDRNSSKQIIKELQFKSS